MPASRTVRAALRRPLPRPGAGPAEGLVAPSSHYYRPAHTRAVAGCQVPNRSTQMSVYYGAVSALRTRTDGDRATARRRRPRVTAPAGTPHHPGAGLAGPPRRYALLVGLLVALACVPTLIAATLGAAALDRPPAAAPTPFISRPAEPPVIIVPAPAGGTSGRGAGVWPGGASGPWGDGFAPAGGGRGRGGVVAAGGDAGWGRGGRVVPAGRPIEPAGGASAAPADKPGPMAGSRAGSRPDSGPGSDSGSGSGSGSRSGSGSGSGVGSGIGSEPRPGSGGIPAPGPAPAPAPGPRPGAGARAAPAAGVPGHDGPPGADGSGPAAVGRDSGPLAAARGGGSPTARRGAPSAATGPALRATAATPTGALGRRATTTRPPGAGADDAARAADAAALAAVVDSRYAPTVRMLTPDGRVISPPRPGAPAETRGTEPRPHPAPTDLPCTPSTLAHRSLDPC
ncbi:hypothetical protein GCM10010123_18540 [Pilimelia anulata]|uniref:Uncharacterized protein n=1 Tax=Pilimelia anulata TaxID=53371 RepID=A0A8J3B2E8_9ACTN|nr:hypothetical protein GCM10010123_18540 [Pilimelia anulata]